MIATIHERFAASRFRAQSVNANRISMFTLILLSTYAINSYEAATTTTHATTTTTKATTTTTARTTTTTTTTTTKPTTTTVNPAVIYQPKLTDISNKIVAMLSTSSTNTQRISSLENTFDYYYGLTKVIHARLAPLVSKITILNNCTNRLAKADDIWYDNFKGMDKMFNQLEKKVKGFKVPSSSYPLKAS